MIFFFSKNTCELNIVLTRPVNILTTNELVKLTTLWTTGPRKCKLHYRRYGDTFHGHNFACVEIFCFHVLLRKTKFKHVVSHFYKKLPGCIAVNIRCIKIPFRKWTVIFLSCLLCLDFKPYHAEYIKIPRLFSQSDHLIQVIDTNPYTERQTLQI